MSAEPRPSGSHSDSGPAVPDRWAELAPLVDAVLDAPAERRSSILMELSATDPALRAEVERLVAECERGMPMLDRRVGDAFSQLLVDDVDLAIPEILGGRYQIEHEIGRGGMALVYVARDLKHARGRGEGDPARPGGVVRQNPLPPRDRDRRGPPAPQYRAAL